MESTDVGMIKIAPEQFLRRHTEWLASLRPTLPTGWHHSPAGFLLQYGKAYNLKLTPARKYRRGQLKECYWNCRSLVRRHPELTYVEGTAVNIIPVSHAWCVDRDGAVIEATWREAGLAYHGVELQRDYVLNETNEPPFIDNYLTEYPLMKLSEGELSTIIVKAR